MKMKEPYKLCMMTHTMMLKSTVSFIPARIQFDSVLDFIRSVAEAEV